MIRRMRRPLFVGAIVACLFVTRPGAQAELRFGGDAEGGAPFMEADPNDPSRVVGFEVDIATLLAAGLGRTPRFVQVGFASLDPAVERGDFDIGLSGIEDNPARRARLSVTVPYYEFREVLTVRRADAARFRSLAELRGKRVATLGATGAAEILERARAEYGVEPVTYEDDVHPYTDLVVGRVDAVVLDAVLAERGVRRNPALVNQPADLGVGHYVGILAPRDAPLRDRIDALLRDAMRDGRMQAIFTRWGMWNEDQPRLYARVTSSESGGAGEPDG
jgi:polar amino acid transport system substrate-binding protein